MAAPASHRTIILPHIIKYIPKNGKLGEEANVYAFDLDHTIIRPKSGGRFSRGAEDWIFMSFSSNKEGESRKTVDTLAELLKSDTNAQVVIFSNQGGIVTIPPTSKSCANFTRKIDLVLQAVANLNLDLQDRIWLYASTKKPASLSSTKRPKTIKKVAKKNSQAQTAKDQSIFSDAIFQSMRKPNPGMFEEFTNDFGRKFKLEYYCGDAAGRKSDFSDSDKLFAAAIKTAFRTPEEVFSE
ncbi:LANO_0G09604g1_1 [Lachancea nothofagi CBS 11611]|uniref:LANO_0G09604g1_1 n=1 Tax=Lachancea nothofagi CBS 11611 TaxID=1266666 RepID=A0A1G4KIF3_9SACH|nr:LANO_0G09604g1_1 [Lachancea nothofagi CBS 11611]